jgi:ribosomal protein S6
MESQISENWLDMQYSTLLGEQNRLMMEMKAKPEQFKELEHTLNLTISIMKNLLKLKAYKQKLKQKADM